MKTVNNEDSQRSRPLHIGEGVLKRAAKLGSNSPSFTPHELRLVVCALDLLYKYSREHKISPTLDMELMVGVPKHLCEQIAKRLSNRAQLRRAHAAELRDQAKSQQHEG